MPRTARTGTGPLAALVERPAHVIGHRHRAMSRKTLPTTVDTFPFVIPISWRQLLRNFEVPSSVGNVFPSNVFPVDETDSQPAIGASTLRVSTGHACLLGASLIVRCAEPMTKCACPETRQACNGIQCFGCRCFSAAMHGRGPRRVAQVSDITAIFLHPRYQKPTPNP
jgi:hypothetical protein